MEQTSQGPLLSDLIDQVHKAEVSMAAAGSNEELMGLIRQDPGHPLSVMARTGIEFALKEAGDEPTPEEQFFRLTKDIAEKAEEYAGLVVELVRLKKLHRGLPKVRLSVLAISQESLVRKLLKSCGASIFI